MAAARSAGFGLLIVGVAFAAIASMVSLVVAAGLAIAVFLYDGPLKRTTLSPFVMGACRALNLVLGASTAATLPSSIIWYALAIGIFVAGITWLAKREANESQSLKHLFPGSLLMVLGLALIGLAAWQFSLAEPQLVQLLPLAVGFISLPILRRLALAWSSASGSAVQATVITSLRSLIIFDACMALLVTDGRPVYSIVILSLVGASWLLGRITKLT